MNKDIKTKSNVVIIATITAWLGIILREIGGLSIGNVIFNISLLVAAFFGLAGLIGLAKNSYRRKNK